MNTSFFTRLMLPMLALPTLQAAELSSEQRLLCEQTASAVKNSSLRYNRDGLKQELAAVLRAVAQGGDVAMCSENGYTALHAACYVADAEAIDMLLAAGADVNAKPGQSPLLLLLKQIDAQNAEPRLAIAEKLLKAGADPDGTQGSIFWCMPYHEAFTAQAQLLLLKYGNQNMAERTKEWDIHWFLLDLSVIRILIEGGVDPNSHVGEKGMTLLANLLRRPYDADLIELVLKKGASVKAGKRTKHYFNDYPFMIQAYNDVHPETAAKIMRLLLDAGCDINGLNRKGESLRIHYGKIKSPAAAAIGEVLRERGAKLHPDAPSSRL